MCLLYLNECLPVKILLIITADAIPHYTTPRYPTLCPASHRHNLNRDHHQLNRSKSEINLFDEEMSLSTSAQGFDQPSPPKSPVDPSPVVSCFLPNKLYSVVSAKLIGGFELVLLHSPWHGASECWTGIHPAALSSLILLVTY
jgi:hypothetical protein